MSTRISYYAETAPRGDDEVVLERQHRLAGAALSRARAGDMGRLYSRNPDVTPRENAEEPFVSWCRRNGDHGARLLREYADPVPLPDEEELRRWLEDPYVRPRHTVHGDGVGTRPRGSTRGANRKVQWKCET